MILGCLGFSESDETFSVDLEYVIELGYKANFGSSGFWAMELLEFAILGFKDFW